MARTVLSPQARLAQLRVAKKRADAHSARATLTAEPMAKLLGVSWQGALRRWCNELQGFEQSGCFVRGGQGIEWTFRVRKTTDWLIRYFEREEQALKVKSSKAERLLGMQEGSLPPGTDIREINSLISAVKQVIQMRIEAGELVKLSDVEDIIRSLLSGVVDRISAIPAMVDPNGKWPLEYKQALESVCFSQIMSVHDLAAEICSSYEGVITG